MVRKPAVGIAGVLIGNWAGLATAQASLPVEPSPALLNPAELHAPVTQDPGMQEQNRLARLHTMLQKYGLGCGNPSCPFCYPPKNTP